MVTTLRSDVYYLLYVYHVLISHNKILTVCLLPYFLKVFCIYIAVWAGELINTGVLNGGVSVSFIDKFLQ